MPCYNEFPRYVSVAEKKSQSAALIAKLRRKNPSLAPVVIEGTQIARSFWGKAWCKHLETFSDFSNRIPRGKSYVRSGAVVDLHLEKGLITALVAGSGSSPYEVRMEIACLSEEKKEAIEALFQRAEAVELLDLLQGRIPSGLMAALIHPHDGIFPRVSEVKRRCSCPDFADFCKHQAAVLYAVGHRLDSQPELLFTLRGLDGSVLTSRADDMLMQASHSELGEQDLASLFGLELVEESVWAAAPPTASTQKKKPEPKKPVRKRMTTRDRLLYIMKYTRWECAELASKLATDKTRVQKWLDEKAVPGARLASRIDALYDEVKSIVAAHRKKQ